MLRLFPSHCFYLLTRLRWSVAIIVMNPVYRVVFFVFCSLIYACEGANVTFVATLFRHGDRTPISFYPNDPWADRKWWPVNGGQLTDTGMLQHFQLGQKYREAYGHLISKCYDSKEIYIRSTDFDRTIMSALSNLAGLYKVNETDEFVTGLPWKPVPIRAIPGYVDDMLGMKAPCPRYDWELNKFTRTKYFKDIYKLYIPTFQYLTEHTGKTINTMLDASYIYDVLFIEDKFNFTLPNWTSTVFPDILKNITQDSLLFETFTPELKRLKSGPIVKEILRLMDKRANNEPSHKFVMYSAHDTTVANVLNSLGMYNLVLPPYAAHMEFELLSPDSVILDHSIRIKYQDEILEIPECGKICPLTQFKELYSWLLPEDHTADCQLKVYQTNHWKLVGGILFLLGIFCLISASVVIFRTKTNSRYIPCQSNHIMIIPTRETNEK